MAHREKVRALHFPTHTFPLASMVLRRATPFLDGFGAVVGEAAVHDAAKQSVLECISFGSARPLGRRGRRERGVGGGQEGQRRYGGGLDDPAVPRPGRESLNAMGRGSGGLVGDGYGDGGVGRLAADWLERVAAGLGLERFFAVEQFSQQIRGESGGGGAGGAAGRRRL